MCAGLAHVGVRSLVLTTHSKGMPVSRLFSDKYGTPVRAISWSGSERRRALRFTLDVLMQLVARWRSYQVVYWTMPGLQAVAGIPLARMLGKVNLMLFPASGAGKILEQSRWGRWLLPVLRHFADAIIILNPEMRVEMEVLGFPAERIHWFPCPARSEAPPDAGRRAELRRDRGLRPDALAITFTGRFVEVKRLQTLVAAFALVARAVPQALLILVGDGPERSRLQAQVAELGLTSRVRFTGFLEEEALLETLYASDLFAIISASEGMPCSLVEAMEAGLPAVVTDIPAMTQLVRDEEQGCVVPVDNVEATAEALLKLLRNPEERLRLGQQARFRIVPDLTIETVAGRYRELLEQLLVKRKTCRK